jgi:hypothetical protein
MAINCPSLSPLVVATPRTVADEVTKVMELPPGTLAPPPEKAKAAAAALACLNDSERTAALALVSDKVAVTLERALLVPSDTSTLRVFSALKARVRSR